MKTPALLALVTVLLLASCASPLQRRMEKNPEIFSALNEKQKALVSTGQIEEGMTKKAVFVAWGKPDRVTAGTSTGKPTERWSYTSYDAVPRVAYGGGLGFGYYGQGRYRGGYYADPYIYPQMYFDYMPFEAAHVVFTGGKVSAWGFARD